MKFLSSFKITILPLIVFNILLCGCTSNVESKEGIDSNIYNLVVNEDNIKEVNVKAELYIDNDTLYMDWEGASFLKDGWSHFVNHISLKNKEGKNFNVKYLSKGRWLIDDLKNHEQMEVNYTVSLNHDIVDWPEGGHDEASYVLDKSIFFVGSSVFITNSKNNSKNYNVTFSLPNQWKISSSLTSEGKNKMFKSYGETELSKSIFFIGDIIRDNMSFDGLSIELVTAQNNQASLDILTQITQPLSSSIKSYFNGNGSNRFYCVINIAPNSDKIKPYFSGGAFPNAISLIIPNQPDNNLIPIVAYFYAHEFVHLWNGIDIKAKYPKKENWFIEGFTDYITLKTLMNLGYINEEFFLNGMQGVIDQYGKYIDEAGIISMREAGINKQKNYNLIYSGGFITAFITDIDIIKSSNGKKSLKDFMQALYSSFGKNKSKHYSIEDLTELMREVQSSSNFGSIIENYVIKKDIIPLENYLTVVGLKLKNDSIRRINPIGEKENKYLQKLMN